MRISDWSSDVCSSDLSRSHQKQSAPFLQVHPPTNLPPTPEAPMHRTLPVLLLALVPALASAQATDASRPLAQDAVIVDTHIAAPGMLMAGWRSEEHPSELQSLMRISYAVFCLTTN